MSHTFSNGHYSYIFTQPLTLQQEGIPVTPEMGRCLSPYLTEHIRRFGHYVLDMATHPEPLQPQPLFIPAV